MKAFQTDTVRRGKCVRKDLRTAAEEQMKNAVLLSAGLYLLFIMTGCVPKYTCAEAPFHCTSCRADAASYIDIPASVRDSTMPQACVLTLKPLPVKDVTDSGSPEADMRAMVSGYREHNDRVYEFNDLVDRCLLALTIQDKKNTEAVKKFCSDRSAVYDASRSVCIPKS